MKAKLIKTKGEFYLCEPNSETSKWIGSTHGFYEQYKLSLKNCQAIELGYDLDELASEWFLINNYNQNDFIHSHHVPNMIRNKQLWIEGFQKALSILSDKKFSESEMKNIYEKGYSSGRNELTSPESDKVKYDYIQSLQQTEWEVEICCYTANGTEQSTNTGIPKVDENNCIILKII